MWKGVLKGTNMKGQYTTYFRAAARGSVNVLEMVVL